MTNFSENSIYNIYVILTIIFKKTNRNDYFIDNSLSSICWITTIPIKEGELEIFQEVTTSGDSFKLSSFSKRSYGDLFWGNKDFSGR